MVKFFWLLLIYLSVLFFLPDSSFAAPGDQFFFWRERHATDCTLLSDGKYYDLCRNTSAPFYMYQCKNTAGCVLPSDWESVSGIPSGNDGSVQFNNNGINGGDDGFVYDDVSGNVGIGSPSPAAALDVLGTVKANSLVTGNGAAIISGNVNGNVGIGTTDAQGLFAVYGTPNSALKVSQTVGGGGNLGVGNFSGQVITAGQSFQIPSTNTVVDVQIYFGANVGAPTGNVTVRIETDSGGNPSGTLADANATKTITPTANAWNTATFDSSFSLTATTTYWIVVSSVNSQSSNNYFQITVATGNQYTGGKSGYSLTSTWAYTSGTDMTFVVDYTGFNFGTTLIVNNNGQVGINNLSPNTALDVTGTATATGFVAGASGITLGGVTNTAWPSSSVWSSSGSNIYFSTGNVGIGTINPEQALVVNGAGKFSSSGDSYINGNLGIGTTVPPNPLYVVGTPMFTGGLNIGIGTTAPTHLCIANNAVTTCP